MPEDVGLDEVAASERFAMSGEDQDGVIVVLELGERCVLDRRDVLDARERRKPVLRRAELLARSGNDLDGLGRHARAAVDLERDVAIALDDDRVDRTDVAAHEHGHLHGIGVRPEFSVADSRRARRSGGRQCRESQEADASEY